MLRSILAASALLLLTPPGASAHALLRSADPAVGSTVRTAPSQLLLVFSETVDPTFSRVEVTDAHGVAEAAGSPRVDPADATHLLLPLKPLAPGAYTVSWHAVSTDTHKTQGKFTFTVAP